MLIGRSNWKGAEVTLLPLSLVVHFSSILFYHSPESKQSRKSLGMAEHNHKMLEEIGGIFEQDLCTKCGMCLQSCPVSSLPISESVEVITKAIINKELLASIARCMLHAACCNLVCPVAANPVGLFREIKSTAYERDGISGVKKLSLSCEKINAFSLVRTALPENEKKVMMRSFYPEPSEILLWLGCVVSQTMPYLVEKTTLFKDMPIAGGPEFCCGGTYLLQGDLKSCEKQASKLAARLHGLGVKHIISVCPGCYVMTHDVYPKIIDNFDITVEYFFEYLWKRYLKGELRYKKLNMKVLYQQPCVFREYNYPSIQSIPRKLLNAMGVEVLADWKRCCGSPIAYTSGESEFAEELSMNAVEEAKKSGAEAVVTSCPSCTLQLAKYCDEAGLSIYYLSELCQMAIGEEPTNMNVVRSKMASDVVKHFLCSSSTFLNENVWPDREEKNDA